MFFIIFSKKKQSIGCDRGVSNLVDAVDKVKQSAIGMRRLFMIEVMYETLLFVDRCFEIIRLICFLMCFFFTFNRFRGRECGYLSMMGAICTGAERVLLPEHTLSLTDLQRDVATMKERFSNERIATVDRTRW